MAIYKKRKKREYHQCIKAVVLRLTSEFAFFRHIIRNSPLPDAESVHKLDFTSFDLDGKSWFLYSNLANSCASLFVILYEKRLLNWGFIRCKVIFRTIIVMHNTFYIWL